MVAVTHFQDPGLSEAKSAVGIPVLGLGETTLHFSLTLGRKIGLVTINPAFIPWHEDQIIKYGMQSASRRGSRRRCQRPRLHRGLLLDRANMSSCFRSGKRNAERSSMRVRT